RLLPCVRMTRGFQVRLLLPARRSTAGRAAAVAAAAPATERGAGGAGPAPVGGERPRPELHARGRADLARRDSYRAARLLNDQAAGYARTAPSRRLGRQAVG